MHPVLPIASLEAMFQHKTTAESINNEVTIPDIRGDVIEKMLRYMYGFIGFTIKLLKYRLLVIVEKNRILGKWPKNC
jgi:hypothetical protein